MLRLLQSCVGVAILLSAGCAQRRSLRADAEAAEDQAIRYADAHAGVHSGHFQSMADYGRVRDQKMAEMFETVAARYGVTGQQVRQSLAHRPLGVDLGVIVSFGVFFACAAAWIAVRSSMAILVYVSLVASAAGVLLLESWATLVESIRLGTGHLSYRGLRIPWAHHSPAVFVAALAVFWLVAILRRKRGLA